MRTFWKWAVVLAVPAIWVAAAWPQEPALPEGTTVKLLLLRQKSVQKELRLTPDQVQKISEFTNKEHEAAREAAKLEGAERERKFAVPVGRTSGRLRIEAILHYRKVDQFLLNYTLGEKSGVTAPVVDIANATAEVCVSREAGATCQ